MSYNTYISSFKEWKQLSRHGCTLNDFIGYYVRNYKGPIKNLVVDGPIANEEYYEYMINRYILIDVYLQLFKCWHTEINRKPSSNSISEMPPIEQSIDIREKQIINRMTQAKDEYIHETLPLLDMVEIARKKYKKVINGCKKELSNLK